MTERPDSTGDTHSSRRMEYLRILTVIGMLVLLPSMATAGTVQATDSTQNLPTQPSLVVELDSDGSARVTVVTTFDLATDGEREAFVKLRENETARNRRLTRFTKRMRSIAAATESVTGRQMAVRDPNSEFVTRNGTGIVALSVEWTGLAATTDGGVVLREPFASGFDLDRTLVVVGPEGYEVATVRPTPSTRTPSRVTWDAGVDARRFSVTFAPDTNGFGIDSGVPLAIGAVLLAILAGATLVIYGRRA